MSLWVFSGYIIIFQTINVLNKSIDKWMLGYNQSAEVLGYYAMAVSIMMLPSMQLLSPIGGQLFRTLVKSITMIQIGSVPAFMGYLLF